jgi:hypothetical protein
MSIYPILAWFNGSWHGSTVQFTAFFLFEKKKKKSRKSWIFNPGDTLMRTERGREITGFRKKKRRARVEKKRT